MGSMVRLGRQNPLQGPCAERGFSLLEGMMASAILATGLLALAAMQGMAMVKNVDANELTRMTEITSDILERIQFNRRNAAIYNGIDTESPTNCAGITQPQARGDCLMWGTLVNGTQLENVQGRVTVLSLAPMSLGQSSITVTMTWMGSQKADSHVKRRRVLTINRVIAPE